MIDNFITFLPSILWVLSLIATLSMSIFDAHRKRWLDARIMIWAGIWGILGAFWGGHVLYLLLNPTILLKDPLLIFQFLESNKVVIGAFLGAGLFSWLYLRWKRVVCLTYADAAIPAVAIGYVLARIGCFLNGDDFGTLSNLPWAMRFPQDTVAFASHLINGWVQPQDALSLPVHPTQLYHAATGLILFFVLRNWQGRWSGSRFTLAIVCYGVSRFFIQFFRGDSVPVLGILDINHIFCLLFLFIGALLWWRFGRQRKTSIQNIPALHQVDSV